MNSAKNRLRTEFGDFQTPLDLAREVCALLASRIPSPRAIVEPTCGRGTFILAALGAFPDVQTVKGLEINPDYVQAAKTAIAETTSQSRTELITADFFKFRWDALLKSLPDPLLVIGNPPWVTNAELCSLGSSNLPRKTNLLNLRGIDAITGKGNFDISEWMLLRVLDWLEGREGALAMLCKTAVARKVLLQAWREQAQIVGADLYPIDAARFFGASVDACLLVARFSPRRQSSECRQHESLRHSLASVFGYRDGQLVADVAKFGRWKHLQGQEWRKWRSGIKHDCASVMELVRDGARYRNGLGELVELEDTYVYPMLKSSELANGPRGEPRRWMLVPQQYVGQNTRQIEDDAPMTWRYLQAHAEQLDGRASSIYRNRPRFAIFGVGDYSFTDWKVAISGFYKTLDFRAVGPCRGRPVVLDDTCYFLPCGSPEEAEFLAELLNSDPARDFFCAFIFWDAKRPITSDLLSRLDILALAAELGQEDELRQFLCVEAETPQQLAIF